MSSPGIKNISPDTSGKSLLQLRPSHPIEGRAHVTNARWDAVDAVVTKTNVAEAYGEVVWFRRPKAGVKFVR